MSELEKVTAEWLIIALGQNIMLQRVCTFIIVWMAALTGAFVWHVSKEVAK